MTNRDAVVEILTTARDIISEVNLEADLRATGFSKAIDLLAAAATTDGAASGTLRQSLASLKPSTSVPHTDGPIGKLAAALHTELDQVELAYVVADDKLDLVLSRSKLPKEKFPAMRTVTILVAAGRQAVGLDDSWTSIDLIREVCRDFGILDTNNFAAAVTAVGDAFVVHGKGVQRKVKVTRAGFEEAGRLLAQLLGSAH
ncbi:MAG TPA: hypothetical protein VK256_02515 [Candidatus Eisenbacteria bacterium]|nr:hypothetical protein [Candidatus Eisenbacteria bacterium]